MVDFNFLLMCKLFWINNRNISKPNNIGITKSKNSNKPKKETVNPAKHLFLII